MDRLMETYGTGRRIRALIAYMVGISIVGFGVLLFAVKDSPLPSPLTAILYFALGVIGEHLSVQFPDGDSIALADPIMFAAMWSFGSSMALLSLIPAVLIQFFTQKKALLNTFFNCGQFTLSIVLASFWARLSAATPGRHAPLVQIVFVFLMVLTFDLANHLFVACAVSIDKEHNWSDVFPRIAFSQRKNSVVLWYLINIAGVLLASFMGLAGIIFVFAGVFALWLQLRFEQELARKSMEARTDVLTGLLNLRYLEDWLNKEFPKFAAEESECSVIFIDVDGLKSVNDGMGHEAGDAVLVHLAKVLKSVIRADDKVVRYGGDEFLLICNKADLDKAEGIAERVLDALARSPLEHHGAAVEFGISAGVASFPKHSVLGRDLIRMADKAMYLAKKDGGNRYYTADSL